MTELGSAGQLGRFVASISTYTLEPRVQVQPLLHAYSTLLMDAVLRHMECSEQVDW